MEALRLALGLRHGLAELLPRLLVGALACRALGKGGGRRYKGHGYKGAVVFWGT